MKNLFLRFSLLTALYLGLLGAAYAKTLKCQQTNAYTMYMSVAAEVEGEFYTYGPRAIFNSISFDYAIYMETMEPQNMWSVGGQTFKALANDEGYRPRVYKNHMKFNVYISGIGGKDGFGELDLVLPRKILLSVSPNSFTGYLIMTAMDDHFGGTVPMECSIN